MQSDTVKAYIVENRGKRYETLSNFKKVSCKRGGLLQSFKNRKWNIFMESASKENRKGV